MPNPKRSRRDAAILSGMGLAVVELRECRRITRTELSRRAAIDSSTLRRIERGQSDATWGTLRKLASALDVSLAEMVEMALELALGDAR